MAQPVLPRSSPEAGPFLVMYQVEFTDAAEDDLSTLHKKIAQQVLGRLRWLAGNAESVRHKEVTSMVV